MNKNTRGALPGAAKAVSVNKTPGLFFPCIMLLVVVFIAYGNTLGNGFAMDDNVMLVRNGIVAKGVEGIPTLAVTPHLWGYHMSDHDGYRPLSLILFAVEYQAWKLWPPGYHFMNILLFGCCVLLLFRFLDELMARSKTGVAFIAAALFAVHPIHTEVVANVKSSDELLSFALAFSGLSLGARYMRSGKTNLLVAAGLCFLLAHLAKESVLSFMAIVPTVFFVFIDGNRRRATALTIAFAAAAAIYGVAYYLVLAYWHAAANTPVALIENALSAPGLSAASRLATAILLMGLYLKMAFLPWPLISDYSFGTIPFTGFGDPLVWLTIAVYAALAVIAARRILKDSRDLYAFAIFFFLVTIAMFSNIVIPLRATFAERFLFYPSVGVCLAIALSLCRMAGAYDISVLNKNMVRVAMAALCLACLGATITRNAEWAGNDTLYGADVAKAPGNTRLNYMYGYDLFTRYNNTPDPVAKDALLTDAIRYTRNATIIYPEYDYALADLAATFFAAGRYDSAIAYGRRAVAATPGYAVPRGNLSAAYRKARRYDEGIALDKETIRLLPNNVGAYIGLGIGYSSLGATDSAIRYMRMGMNMQPRYTRLYQVMADIYYAAGNMDSAGYYRQVAGAMSGR